MSDGPDMLFEVMRSFKMELASNVEILCAKYDSLLTHDEKQYLDEYKLSLVNETGQKFLLSNSTSPNLQLFK